MSSLTWGSSVGSTINSASSVWVDPNPVTKGYIDDVMGVYKGEGINIIIEDNESLSSLLSVCYKETKDNFIVFKVFIDHLRKEPNPIEDVMRMISKKQTFDFTITRDGYKLDVKEAKFIRIKNLIETSANQYIEVEYVFENMEYDNTLKSELDKRSEKMDLLKHKIEQGK
jgi:hypothetical protein